jgi:hypothetical protein
LDFCQEDILSNQFSFADFGMILGQFWADTETNFGSDFGIGFALIFGQFWADFGPILETILGQIEG